ncbi:pyridoxamine 5'-phosphate oxidase family protein [Cryobacterium sp. PAMC25264]|uniref:pyridoxamine 5'-phosphate oxidase family protein n=1 Tax=Cryobacterium sp. PAMC25264 TaxID=2861288 RepID=UPI001C631B6E|nr:pyridoxamine 5'-phosphate oxidase family protein [Cryobacterium sp. PAMC25264]QYF72407.1 pyridoxamine 5'-phosphate oxidase family protein [Cryobacterium sp. PAMC25264]
MPHSTQPRTNELGASNASEAHVVQPRTDAPAAAPATAPATLSVTDRTRITRAPERQRTDRAELYGILDDALVAHVAIVRDGLPLVLPMGFGRGDDAIYLHGSTGSGIFRAMASGTPISVTVTHLDGRVYARSLFESSMNYRSAVVFGVPTVVAAADKEEAMRVVSEHLMPGRWAEVREMTKRELAATLVLRLPLDEASVKVRAHGASESVDDGDDRSIWAGVLPLRVTAAAPETSELTPAGTPVSGAALAYAAQLFSVSSESGDVARIESGQTEPRNAAG